MPVVLFDRTDGLLTLGVAGPATGSMLMPFDIGGAGIVSNEQPFDIQSPYIGVTNVQPFDISGMVSKASIQPFDIGEVTRGNSIQTFDVIAAITQPLPGVPSANPVIAFYTSLAANEPQGATKILVTSAGAITPGTTIQINYVPPVAPSPNPSGGDTTGGTTGTTTGTGSSMPIGDLVGWRHVFADDFNVPFTNGTFNGSSNYSTYPTSYHDTSGNGTYDPSIISAHDGVLDVYLHTSGTPRVAAFIPKPNGTSGGNMLYGRYAIRFKSDPLHAYKTAWLLWPQSGNWPHDGEIDFPEGNLDGHISAFMHRQNATSGGDQDAFSTSVSYTSWHTAVLEWLPTRCTFILDGVTIGQATSRIPNTPMHWVVQTETALDGSFPSPTTAGHVYIDWLSMWAYAP